MNTKHYVTRFIVTLTSVSAMVGTLGLPQAGLAQETGSTAKTRVGIYDSRAVAVAFAGSAAFNRWLSNLKAEHEKAKASGDQKRVAELEAEGAARQRLLHMQGFSTAPVTNILDQISAHFGRGRGGVVGSRLAVPQFQINPGKNACSGRPR